MEVVGEVRRKWPGARVRIVAVTADAFEDTREQCLAGGFNGWCAFPPGRLPVSAPGPHAWCTSAVLARPLQAGVLLLVLAQGLCVLVHQHV